MNNLDPPDIPNHSQGKKVTQLKYSAEGRSKPVTHKLPIAIQKYGWTNGVKPQVIN